MLDSIVISLAQSVSKQAKISNECQCAAIILPIWVMSQILRISYDYLQSLSEIKRHIHGQTDTQTITH